MALKNCRFDAGWLLVFIACVLIVLLFTFTLVFQKEQFSCSEDESLTTIFYPQQEGWLGSDVSTSIKLYNGTMLWLFGDTLVGNLVSSSNGSIYRNVSAFVHGSIALLNMDGDRKPNFYIKKLPNGDADTQGFFRPLNSSTNSTEYYWTLVGAVLPKSNSLVVLAAVIINRASGYEETGSDAILVKNIYDDPYLWDYTTSRIPQSRDTLSLNVGITINSDDGYVYILGHDTTQGLLGCSILAKISQESLYNFNWADLQFWQKSRTWSYSSDSNNLMVLVSGVVSETTLFYHSSIQQWYYLALSGFDNKVLLASSKALTGPWSTQILYEIPEPFSNRNLYYTYASKEHPEYENSPNQIVFTYNTNTKNFWDLWADVNIYHPIFITCTQNYFVTH